MESANPKQKRWGRTEPISKPSRGGDKRRYRGEKSDKRGEGEEEQHVVDNVLGTAEVDVAHRQDKPFDRVTRRPSDVGPLTLATSGRSMPKLRRS